MIIQTGSWRHMGPLMEIVSENLSIFATARRCYRNIVPAYHIVSGIIPAHLWLDCYAGIADTHKFFRSVSLMFQVTFWHATINPGWIRVNTVDKIENPRSPISDGASDSNGWMYFQSPGPSAGLTNYTRWKLPISSLHWLPGAPCHGLSGLWVHPNSW